jgi:Zn-dependent protease
VARAFRLKVQSITLFVFGGVANLPREPDEPKAEFAMAAVGPLMSLALAGLFWGGGRAADVVLRGSPGLITVYALDRLAFVNALLGIFNLLPGFPLDGGRVLRSIWWALRGDRRAATRVATRGGQILAGILLVLGLLQLVDPNRELFVNGMWSILVAIFLYNAATASYRHEAFDDALRRTNVGSLMTRDLAFVPADLPLSSLVSTYVLPMRGRAFPVERLGELVGLVSIADVRRVPREQWQSRRVAEVMSKLEGDTLAPSDDAAQGWAALLRNGAAEIPVMEDGRLVGLLEREVVINYLRMRETLGLDSRRR